MHITKIKETCLYTSDLEAAKQFYNGLLEFEIINHQIDRFIFFRVGTSVLLCFNPESSKRNDSPPPHFAHGSQHIAFEVAPDEYNDWKEKVTSLGIELIEEVKWKNEMKSFYFKDPEGHLLEIVPQGIWE